MGNLKNMYGNNKTENSDVSPITIDDNLSFEDTRDAIDRVYNQLKQDLLNNKFPMDYKYTRKLSEYIGLKYKAFFPDIFIEEPLDSYDDLSYNEINMVCKRIGLIFYEEISNQTNRKIFYIYDPEENIKKANEQMKIKEEQLKDINNNLNKIIEEDGFIYPSDYTNILGTSYYDTSNNIFQLSENNQSLNTKFLLGIIHSNDSNMYNPYLSFNIKNGSKYSLAATLIALFHICCNNETIKNIFTIDNINKIILRFNIFLAVEFIGLDKECFEEFIESDILNAKLSDSDKYTLYYWIRKSLKVYFDNIKYNGCNINFEGNIKNFESIPILGIYNKSENDIK